MKSGEQQFYLPPGSFGTVTDFTQRRRRSAGCRLRPGEGARQIVHLACKDGNGATDPVFQIGKAPQTTRQDDAVDTSGKRSRSEEQVGKFGHRILPF